MALVYFDSSALVKLVIEEDGSDLVAELWDTSEAALASRLAYPEVCAALAALHRNHDLDESAHRAARADWEVFWAATRVIELTVGVAQNAGALAPRRDLRGADAVHLASALAVGVDDLVVAVWDRRLHTAVVSEGLRAAPAVLGR